MKLGRHVVNTYIERTYLLLVLSGEKRCLDTNSWFGDRARGPLSQRRLARRCLRAKG